MAVSTTTGASIVSRIAAAVDEWISVMITVLTTGARVSTTAAAVEVSWISVMTMVLWAATEDEERISVITMVL